MKTLYSDFQFVEISDLRKLEENLRTIDEVLAWVKRESEKFLISDSKNQLCYTSGYLDGQVSMARQIMKRLKIKS